MTNPDDLALLRRFEPILHFTEGEQFFPMDVERYVSEARLCVQRPNDLPAILVPRGELSVARLVQPRHDVAGAVLYMSFADALNPAQVLSFYRNSSLRNFHAGRGRLARVGLVARIVDLVFSMSLLARGRVPGGLAADAALRYQGMQAASERYCYYGRVVRENGYIALQYWFFYAFNDWRSSFYGVNDHESDWEMVTVYAVEDDDGEPRPAWLAYSSHEFEGDDLRRRWDDPEVLLDGEHPLVYVGAGSHANYYRPGEYLPVAEVPAASRLLRAWRRVRRFWRVTLRQGGEYSELPDLSFFRIPFVDYARGDGLRVGAGQQRAWQAQLLSSAPDAPAPAWVDGYRGLWGLYTRDPIAGEDAPAGPKYRRDGTVRKMWYDPLGWGGLDKVPPPQYAAAVLDRQQERLREEQSELEAKIVEQTALLMGLEMEAEAIAGLVHLREHNDALQLRIQVNAEELDALKYRRATNQQILEGCATYADALAAGLGLPPRAHIRLPQMPASPGDLRLGRLAETWSALSIGLLLVTFATITQLSNRWEVWLLALLGIYGFIEALFRRQVQVLIRYLVVSLALIAAIVLLYQFFWVALVSLVLFAGLLIIVENVRELRA
jgi:hypothetical protein